MIFETVMASPAYCDSDLDVSYGSYDITLYSWHHCIFQNNFYIYFYKNWKNTLFTGVPLSSKIRYWDTSRKYIEWGLLCVIFIRIVWLVSKLEVVLWTPYFEVFELSQKTQKYAWKDTLICHYMGIHKTPIPLAS